MDHRLCHSAGMYLFLYNILFFSKSLVLVFYINLKCVLEYFSDLVEIIFCTFECIRISTIEYVMQKHFEKFVGSDNLRL